VVSRLPLTLAVAAAVVVVDQVAKALAVATLEGQPPIELLGSWLQLAFVRNPGAAFSLAGNYTVVISLIAIAVATLIVRSARTLTNVWWAVVLGGILGGALGNLVDRLFRAPGPFRGHVVDFLELPSWPVFNVADMALVGSAALAVVLSILGVDMGQPEPADGPGASADGPGAPGSDDPAAPGSPRDESPEVAGGAPEGDAGSAPGARARRPEVPDDA
jgi:signal peptidase II